MTTVKLRIDDLADPRLTPEQAAVECEEEVELQALDFASYTLEWHARVPGWRDPYLQFDAVERFAYLRTVLKALTFLRGPRQWMLKSPQHLKQLPALAATFPDATVAVARRDPVVRLERLLRARVRDRGAFALQHSIDVPFDNFMSDDVAMVGRIYERAGVEMTPEARARFDAHMSANPRGKHGQIVYDVRGDFGLDPADVRERFGFYFDRFDIRPEV